MKKVIILFFLLSIVCLAVSAQTASIEQRLVGTWEYNGANGWSMWDSEGNIPLWIFNSDGSMAGAFKLDYRDGVYSVSSYNVASNRLLLNFYGGAGVVFICEYFISSDDRNLIIIIEGENNRGENKKLGLSFRRRT